MQRPASPSLAHRPGVRALALAAALVLPVSACSAHPPQPVVSTPLATVEVFDRTTNVALPVYLSGSERWIEGVPGHEYAIRIRNPTGARILAVPSVDGVNTVTGETAAPDQSGYVIDPWGSVEIAGWRKSLSNTAAFYFTSVPDSYAGRTGRPLDVGVIGVAVFRERVPVAFSGRDKIASRAQEAERGGPPMAAPAPAAANEQAAGASGLPGKDQAAPLAQPPAPELAAKRRDERLGTGHGRNETSYAQRVAFERATPSPESVIAIRYDRRESLVARGIIPGPRYAQRTPSAFPGWTGFVPDPR